MNHGRRIVWVFDESSSGEKNNFGRFRHEGYLDHSFIPLYKWLYKPRRILVKGPDLKRYSPGYSVCVYAGEKDDTLHRIIFEEFSYEMVAFSMTEIEMRSGMDLSQFFRYDEYWMIEDQKALARRKEEEARQAYIRALQRMSPVRFVTKPKRNKRF